MPPYDLAPFRPLALPDLVRVGRANDGGYVIPRRCVGPTRLLVGLGINDDWSFEAAFVRANPAARVVGVDGSVSPAVFRARARRHLRHAAHSAVKLRDLRWARQCVDAARRERATGRAMAGFFDGRPHRFVPRYFGAPGDRGAVTWDALLADAGPAGGGPAAGGAPPPRDVFLKMDIEGAEYATLDSVAARTDRLTGVVLEFHELDARWAEFERHMTALAGPGAPFAVAHLHGNNNEPCVPGTGTPRVVEVTLVPRALLDGTEPPDPGPFPRPGLDMPCSPYRDDYPLTF